MNYDKYLRAVAELDNYRKMLWEAYRLKIEIKEGNVIDYAVIDDTKNIQGVLAAQYMKTNAYSQVPMARVMPRKSRLTREPCSRITTIHPITTVAVRAAATGRA